jgi:hypothetical protein
MIGFCMTHRWRKEDSNRWSHLRVKHNRGTGPMSPTASGLNVHGPDVRVSNVVPHGPEGAAGGVEFVLTMDAPTDVAVTITVLDPWDLVSGWTRGN